jgi:large subunit ribosomal protein L10e
MGDTKAQFQIEGRLIALERAQIRHSALEAARVATNRILMDKVINDYYMLVHPYPHIILRENKMIFGAHADRLQQGMRRSFGAAIGTAAKVEVEQTIITVRVKAGQEAVARESLKRGSAKLPIPCKIVISKIEASPIQTEEKSQPEMETT